MPVSVASAQQFAIPPGKEAIILEAVREAFAGAPPAAAIRVEGTRIVVETTEGPALEATCAGDVRVELVCEP